jgi:hypothetical protein
MEVRRFKGVRPALEFMGIKPPGITRKMSQDDIDKLVEEWKAGELRDRYKELQKEWHPDRNGGTAEATKRFQDLGAAYEEIKDNLKLRKPKEKPAEVRSCRGCSSARVPDDAQHCYNCGLAYLRDAPRTDCPACSVSRNPTRAKFCHACGYDYQVPDNFHEVLAAKGFTRKEIEEMEADGTVARWRKVFRISPFHPELRKAMDDKMMMTKMRRKIGKGIW